MGPDVRLMSSFQASFCTNFITGFTAITGRSFLSRDERPQLEPLSLLSILEYLSRESVAVDPSGFTDGSTATALLDSREVRFLGTGGCAVALFSLLICFPGSMNIAGGGRRLPVEEARLCVDCSL